MPLDERQRHDLHEAARRSFGDDAAVTLMEMLPPVGWADVATKRDLDQLDTRFDQVATRFDQLADRFDAKLARLETRLVLWFVGTGVAVVSASGILQFA